jgi:RNA polymerase sigma-70 factor (ECF subfamily)
MTRTRKTFTPKDYPTEPGRDLQGWSDVDLVAALPTHWGKAACAELYHRHARAVRAAVKPALAYGDFREDVLSEVFIRLWTGPEKFDSERSTLRQYLCMSARSRNIEFIRAEEARRCREDGVGRKAGAESDKAEDAVLASEVVSAVRHALASLPARESEPIELGFFAGLSYREVAVELELPEGTVKGRIRNGLVRMRSDYFVRGQRDGDAA